MIWIKVANKAIIYHSCLIGGGLVLTFTCFDNLLELLKRDSLATVLLGQV